MHSHERLDDSSISQSHDVSDSLPIPQSLTPVSHAVRCRQCLLSLSDHWLYTVAISMLTVYALVGDDFRLATTEKDTDDVFFSLNVVCLACFAFDLVAASVAREKYLLSFFFWLDVVSTLSLVADIGWIWELLLGSGVSVKQTVRSSQALRAGRASRAGTRIARIIRIFRLVRMTRIVKLYRIAKQTREASNKQDESGMLQRTNVSYRGFGGQVAQPGTGQAVLAPPELSVTEDECAAASFTFGSHHEGSVAEEHSDLIKDEVPKPKPADRLRTIGTIERDDIDDMEIPKESVVGKTLSDLTTQRTIIIVLGLMLVLPIFANSLYIEDNTSYLYGLKIILRFAGRREFDTAWENYIEEHKEIETPLIYLEVPGIRKWEGSTHWYDVRPEEQHFVDSKNTDFEVKSTQIFAVFNLAPQIRFQSFLNIGKTIFICLVLSVTAILFSKDANTLVIGPIEAMVEKVQRIAKNPLEAAHQADREAAVLQPRRDLVLLETLQLERTIEKIGALLAIAFGEAGCEVIVANMRQSKGEVEPMIPGRRTDCIFGFCDIRNFTDATEVLQEGVMTFVNEIALVVHSTVYGFLGATNKNIGDAFLLVWRLPSSVRNAGIEPHLLPEKHIARQLCDLAVMSFLKILARIHTNPVILKYRHFSELTARMPNYSVKMGFGLHVGWAIEGAIGSEYKVDASYLSPHVNMASRLEAATKQYGVTMLFSEKVYQLSTPLTRRLLREIDFVVLKGVSKPIRLFTIDCSPAMLVPEPSSPMHSEKDSLKLALSERRTTFRRAIIREKKQITSLYEEDEDFATLLGEDLSEFRRQFSVGFWRYREGKWAEAAVLLKKAELTKGREDGPSRTLLAFMAEFQYNAPHDWSGFRELSEK